MFLDGKTVSKREKERKRGQPRKDESLIDFFRDLNMLLSIINKQEEVWKP